MHQRSSKDTSYLYVHLIHMHHRHMHHWYMYKIWLPPLNITITLLMSAKCFFLLILFFFANMLHWNNTSFFISTNPGLGQQAPSAASHLKGLVLLSSTCTDTLCSWPCSGWGPITQGYKCWTYKETMMKLHFHWSGTSGGCGLEDPGSRASLPP